MNSILNPIPTVFLNHSLIRYFVLFSSLLGLIFFFSNPALAKRKKVIWLKYSSPSIYNRVGNYAGQGAGDKIVKYFQNQMPEYDHEVRWATSKRVVKELPKDGRCSANLWLHFLPELIYYSKPYSTISPYGIVIHKKNQHLFGKKGDVLSLEALLKNPSLTLGTLSIYSSTGKTNTRYPILHKYLSPYIGQKNLYEYVGTENLLSPKFLEYDRLHYILQFPEYISVQEKINHVQNDFIFYKIKEHNLYKKVAAACSNTPFGREIIGKINTALTPETIKQFLEYIQEWNGDDPIYRKKMINYYLKEQKDPDIVN